MQNADLAAPIVDALDGVDPAYLESVLQLLAKAHDHKVMGYGCGREGLQVQGFIMRLHHLGFTASMQGDMTAPPLGPDDLFVVSAGPGELSTVRALMGQARAVGANVLLITALPVAPLAAMADHTLVIPATTMATDRANPSVLPMGSVFEGALFLLFEAMVLRLASLLDQSPEKMRARHTNME